MDSALEMLSRADAARMGVTSAVGAIPMGGGQRDKMLQALVNMEEAVDRIREIAARFSEEAGAVESLVTGVQRADPQAGRLLRMIYLKGMSPTDAAGECGCSRGTVYAALKRGLDTAYALMGEEGVISWR